MVNFKQIFCWHKWVHVTRYQGATTDTEYFRKCDKCGKTKPDPEQERFNKFIDESRAAGLTTEQMQKIIRHRGI